MLEWDRESYACYSIYWNTSAGVSKSDNSIANVQPPFVHEGLEYGKIYYYAVTSANCVYEIESDLSNEVSAHPGLPDQERAKLIGVDANDGDRFGSSISSDGNHVIVGARYAASGTGAGYIFSHDTTGQWSWGIKVTASDPQLGALFGWAVSIDYANALVGAWGVDGAGSRRDAAYVYGRDQGGVGNWGEVKKLTPSTPEDDAYFAGAVSLDSDTAIVGAEGEDGDGTDCGAAYVFYRNQDGAENWGQVAKLTASDTADGDLFGYAVAISGDCIVVGSVQNNGSGSNRGAAYVFYRDLGGTDNWGEVEKLVASDAGDEDWFGGAVSIERDIIVIGAQREDGAGSDRGPAYVFGRNQGETDNWGEIAKLAALDAEDGDFALIGAPDKDGGGTSRGAAYAFHRNQGGTDAWGEINRLTASDAVDSDGFGQAVSIRENYALVGSPRSDYDGPDRGAVYIF